MKRGEEERGREKENVVFKRISVRVRRSRFTVAAAVLGMVLVAVGGWAAAGQDKYTLQVPNGLPFSDFKGYEDWQVVAVSQTDALLKVMVANPTMIAAYKNAQCVRSPRADRLAQSNGHIFGHTAEASRETGFINGLIFARRRNCDEYRQSVPISDALH